MLPVRTGTKTEVARISKKFSHRLANVRAWQESWECSESTQWPPLQSLLKAGLWVSDREDVEAHHRLLVRPILNPAVQVSGGEVAKVNAAKGSEPGDIWAYDGSMTALPNEIKMLRYNLLIVELTRPGGWILVAQIVCVLSQGVLGSFHGHHGDLCVGTVLPRPPRPDQCGPYSLACSVELRMGVSSEGPYNAADVVKLLKTSVRKGDTEEDVQWQRVMYLASTGQPLFQQKECPDQAADADSSESEVEEVPDLQTPKPKGKTDKQGEKEQEKAERDLRKQEETRERNRKKEEKEREKKAKKDERANCKRKEEEDQLATAAAAASPC